jgi:deoxyribose-phosphate aldolase
MTKQQIAKMIDHTLLSAVATKDQIKKLCEEAKRYQFASVCINPVNVKQATELLSGTGVSVCTVIGFPLGASASEDKAAQTEHAVVNGADEVDMVIDIGAAKEHRYEDVENDIRVVVESARETGKTVGKPVVLKVILETCYLTDEEIAEVCLCAKAAGADFVKTSTGFGTPKAADGTSLPNGATVHHVALMRKTVGSGMGVKASGGIHTADQAAELVKAGATRLGASSGVAIVEGWKEEA